MLQRKAYEHLVKWKNTTDKKALLITGARQIGKTYIIRKFAEENYSNFIEIISSQIPMPQRFSTGI